MEIRLLPVPWYPCLGQNVQGLLPGCPDTFKTALLMSLIGFFKLYEIQLYFKILSGTLNQIFLKTLAFHVSQTSWKTACLLVIGSEDNPSAEAVAQVYYPSAADAANNVRESCPHSQDECLEIRSKAVFDY